MKGQRTRDVVDKGESVVLETSRRTAYIMEVDKTIEFDRIESNVEYQLDELDVEKIHGPFESYEEAETFIQTNIDPSY